MDFRLIGTLRASQADIRERWRAYLHEEQVITALGDPAHLVHLFDKTIEEVFAELELASGIAGANPVATEFSMVCPCGKNPYLAYFRAGERALVETLRLLETRVDEEPTGAAEELIRSIRGIARREIELFCSLCLFRAAAMKETNVQVLPTREAEAGTTKVIAFPASPPTAPRAAPVPWNPSIPTSP